MNRHATAADFTRWEEMAANMTDAKLHYASLDCFHTALLAAMVLDSVEGFYLDQGYTYGDALRRRANR